MAEFSVNVRGNGTVDIVDIKGYLDAHTVPELENIFDKLIKDEKYKVIINFEGLKYINSAGLGVFMAYVEPIRENEGDIKFTNLSENVYNIFDLLGFPVLFDFFKEETEAVNKFNEQG